MEVIKRLYELIPFATGWLTTENEGILYSGKKELIKLMRIGDNIVVKEVMNRSTSPLELTMLEFRIAGKRLSSKMFPPELWAQLIRDEMKARTV